MSNPMKINLCTQIFEDTGGKTGKNWGAYNSPSLLGFSEYGNYILPANRTPISYNIESCVLTLALMWYKTFLEVPFESWDMVGNKKVRRIPFLYPISFLLQLVENNNQLPFLPSTAKFFCDMCGKGYKFKHNLVEHLQNTHTNDRLYKCYICAAR